MKKSLSKKAEKVIEWNLEEFKEFFPTYEHAEEVNAVERSFREVRQRVRGIGRFKDEERALTMVYFY